MCIKKFLVKFTSSDLKWPRPLYIYLLMTAIASPTNATFNITDTKLYVPAFTSSTEDDKKLLA